MDLVDQVILDIRNRMAELQRDYDTLAKAEEALTEAGLINPRPRAARKPSARRLAVVPQTPAAKLPAPRRREVRLNVQTLTQNPEEFRDREVAHVTQEGGKG